MRRRPSGCRPPRSAETTVGQVKRMRPLSSGGGPCAGVEGYDGGDHVRLGPRV